MRFRRLLRPTGYRETPRRRAAFLRKQRLEREARPLFADAITARQHSVDEEMARRYVWWDVGRAGHWIDIEVRGECSEADPSLSASRRRPTHAPSSCAAGGRAARLHAPKASSKPTSRAPRTGRAGAGGRTDPSEPPPQPRSQRNSRRGHRATGTMPLSACRSCRSRRRTGGQVGRTANSRPAACHLTQPARRSPPPSLAAARMDLRGYLAVPAAASRQVRSPRCRRGGCVRRSRSG
ncbi:hypothetical protein ACVIM9_006678 [Bradyrhizobium sp. USDA 4520]